MFSAELQDGTLVLDGEHYAPRHPLRVFFAALHDIGLKLCAMNDRERDFWTLRAYRAGDRATRRHQASYGRRRATNGHSQWVVYE